MGMPTPHRKSPGAHESLPAGDDPAATAPDTLRIAAGNAATETSPAAAVAPAHAVRPREIGGRGGADPTRFGDWEKDGRCIDF